MTEENSTLKSALEKPSSTPEMNARETEAMVDSMLWDSPLPDVAKMASHAIFQYNVLVIDIDNTTLGLI